MLDPRVPIPGTFLYSICGEACKYSPAQHRLAVTVAWALQRGLFVLTIPPDDDADA